jgi:hypothetical protein
MIFSDRFCPADRAIREREEFLVDEPEVHPNIHYKKG